MMGISTENDEKRLRQRLVENPSYYEDAARNNLANAYSKWKSSPTGLPTLGPAQAFAMIIKYCPQYSTGSKYTYRYLRKYALHSGSIWDTWGSHNYWGDEHWLTSCFSFSKDKSEMIRWSTDDPENRDYYVQVNISELRPNTDFLY